LFVLECELEFIDGVIRILLGFSVGQIWL
jgi:hypothetical protein